MQETDKLIFFLTVISDWCFFLETQAKACGDDLLKSECKSDGACIRKDWFCDGTSDCENGEDETNCGMLYFLCGPGRKSYLYIFKFYMK